MKEAAAEKGEGITVTCSEEHAAREERRGGMVGQGRRGRGG